eukprot:jgi/Mesvir1/2189/Mv16694-RA.1
MTRIYRVHCSSLLIVHLISSQPLPFVRLNMYFFLNSAWFVIMNVFSPRLPILEMRSETRNVIMSIRNLRKVTPTGKEILKNINLGIYMGAKIGFLGANGSGKSSLMKILAGVDEGSDGVVDINPNIKIGYLEQEPKLDAGETVMANIEPAIAATRQLLSDFDKISMQMAEPDADFDALSGKMERLQAEIDRKNAWELDRMLDLAMDSLRCPPGDAKVDVLSGGERRRVALCRLLLEQPDVLLLDEPTNHLDAEAVAWLERYLASFAGTVVAVTHDRYFLDNVAGWILELDRGQGIPFEGNYSAWLDAKASRLTQEQKTQSALQKAMAQELEWISKQKQGQQKKGKARLRKYEDLVAEAAKYEKQEKMETIYIPSSVRLGGQVIDAQGLAKGYGERLLIDDLSCTIPPGAVVGIVGGNGAGKTTLFRMIVGQEKPDAGVLSVGETVRVMYVDQSRDSLDPNKTVYEEISGGAEFVQLGDAKVNARAYCSWYNFKSADQQKNVSMLSGGERNRLHMAKTFRQGGNLLLLDEPTNDLDVDMLRALEDGINNFAGVAIIISHDRWFLDRVCTHIIAFEGDSKVKFFEGSYSEYAEDYQKRNGGKDPTRMKFRSMVTA